MPSTLGIVAAAYRAATMPIPTTGLQGWWDAADTASITASAGAVSQWNDKSGAGRHVVQATAGLKPTTGTRTLNGLNVLDFTGDVLMTAAVANLVHPLTLFAVVRSDITSTSNSSIFGFNSSSAVFYVSSSGWSLYDGNSLNTNVQVDLTPHVTTVKMDGGGTGDEIWIDGVSKAANNVGGSGLAWAAYPLPIGNAAALDGAWDGIIAEAIIYNRVLSTGERQQVESYLRTKWATDTLFEPFNNFTDAPWTTVTGTPTIVAGRTVNAAQLDSTDIIVYDIPAARQSDVITVGFAWRCSDLASTVRTILEFRSDAGVTVHNQLNLQASTKVLEFTRGVSSPVIASSAATAITQGNYAYIEVQAKLHDSTGYVIVRVNGVEVINATGLDTKLAGTKTVYDQLRLVRPVNSGVQTGRFDDLYLTMGAGATFKGDITIP